MRAQWARDILDEKGSIGMDRPRTSPPHQMSQAGVRSAL